MTNRDEISIDIFKDVDYNFLKEDLKLEKEDGNKVYKADYNDLLKIVNAFFNLNKGQLEVVKQLIELFFNKNYEGSRVFWIIERRDNTIEINCYFRKMRRLIILYLNINRKIIFP